MSWNKTLGKDMEKVEFTWDEAEERDKDCEEWCNHIALCATKACGRNKI